MDNKCVYCDQEANGDCSDYWEPLIMDDISYGTKVDIRVAHILGYAEDVFRKEIELPMPSKESDANGKISASVLGGQRLLSVLICDKNGDEIFERNIKVNYCPMCGRKLGGDAAE